MLCSPSTEALSSSLSWERESLSVIRLSMCSVNNCSAYTTIYTHTCQAVEFQEITSEPSDMNLETIYFLNPSSTSSVIVSNAATAEISNPS